MAHPRPAESSRICCCCRCENGTASACASRFAAHPERGYLTSNELKKEPSGNPCENNLLLKGNRMGAHTGSQFPCTPGPSFRSPSPPAPPTTAFLEKQLAGGVMALAGILTSRVNSPQKVRTVYLPLQLFLPYKSEKPGAQGVRQKQLVGWLVTGGGPC